MRNRHSRLGGTRRIAIAVPVAMTWAALVDTGATAMVPSPPDATATATVAAGGSPVAHAVGDLPGSALAVAKAATVAQAEALGTPLGAPLVVAEHSSPSAALAELLARYQPSPTPAEAGGFAGLDALEAPLRQSVTRVIDAFLASQDATAAAYADADPDELRRLVREFEAHAAGADVPTPPDVGHALRQAGMNLAPMLSARLTLLDAAAELERAVAEAGAGGPEAASAGPGPTAATSCGEPTSAVPTVVAIDAVGEANCYNNDFRLVVDLGGRDTYNNNAGGTSSLYATTPLALLGWPAGYWNYDAALVDVGSQDDRYVSARFGSNGGGSFGSGFLYDNGGDDTYNGGSWATNGGGGECCGYAGVGSLYDGWGADTYTAGGGSSNGGGYWGTGLLVDGAGNDSYKATPGSWGTNGGGGAGVGSLIDLGEGTDAYRTGGNSWPGYFEMSAGNGGGTSGTGLLLDAGGTGDTYTTISKTNVATTLVDDSEVPKGAGAQIDNCRIEVDDADKYLAQVCAAVTGTVAAVSIDDLIFAEKDSGSTTATFTVSLSKPWKVPVVVDYSSADGTASAGSDYTPVSGTLTFAPDETSKTISATAAGDTVTEDNESFSVALTQVTGAAIAKGRGQWTILNDDPPAVRINDLSLSEGDSGTKAFNLSLSLSVPTTKVVSLNYSTADATAVAPGDYTATGGTLTFAPGTTTATVTVLVNGDTVIEPNEWFFVNLSGVTNATVAKAQGKANILNDDFEA